MTDDSVTLWPPCLCPSGGHKHGISVQSSINLGDTLLQMTCEWKTAETWFLARLFIYQASIVSQTLDFFHWMVMIFILITWLVKTENFKINRFDKWNSTKIPRLPWAYVLSFVHDWFTWGATSADKNSHSNMFESCRLNSPEQIEEKFVTFENLCKAHNR